METDKKQGDVTEDKAVHKDELVSAPSSSSSDDAASGSNPTLSDDDTLDAMDTSSSSDGHGPPGSPLPSSVSSPSHSSTESD